MLNECGDCWWVLHRVHVCVLRNGGGSGQGFLQASVAWWKFFLLHPSLLPLWVYLHNSLWGCSVDQIPDTMQNLVFFWITVNGVSWGIWFKITFNKKKKAAFSVYMLLHLWECYILWQHNGFYGYMVSQIRELMWHRVVSSNPHLFFRYEFLDSVSHVATKNTCSSVSEVQQWSRTSDSQGMRRTCYSLNRCLATTWEHT